MIDLNALNSALIGIAEKKIQLNKSHYSDADYDVHEEELHQLEDDFLTQYGSYLEEVLADVHDELCPDNDVLLPIAYLAKKYIRKGENKEGKPVYDVGFEEGVIVDADDYPKELTRLVLIPSPIRLVLQVGQRTREQVWQA